MNYEDEGDAAAAEMMVIERPRSWTHLLKTLFTVDEYRLLKLQNSDGYFYLLYLKYSVILFGISKLTMEFTSSVCNVDDGAFTLLYSFA